MSAHPVASVECLVVGAGVIGLAIARALAVAGHEVLIAERESRFGSQISARSSEVIHAGIYYPPGSLKARTCVSGAKRLYRYCLEHRIAHRRCGKLIVACDTAQSATLERLAVNAERCGVEQLFWLDAHEAQALEPGLRCVAALHSPATGIIDAHEYMLTLLGEAEACGASIVYGAEVNQAQPCSSGFAITLAGETEPTLTCRRLINAAGLGAAALAARVGGLAPTHVPTQFLAKGSYFSLSGPAPFQRLIYPLPDADGLGIHLTTDIAGHARFGPDVEWTDQVDYAVAPERGRSFYAAIRRYWPALRDGALRPAYAGVRPKLSGPGAPAADFVISAPEHHGIPGLINLFGIESPGLTASLDLADRVLPLI